jgi:titin
MLPSLLQPGAASAAKSPTGETAAAVVPGAPTDLKVGSFNRAALLTFMHPYSPGVYYEVSIDGGSWTDLAWEDVTGGRMATVENLDNGTRYEFRVRAANSAGAGPPSKTVPVLIGQPSSPSKVTATAGTSSIAVSWKKPSRNPELVTGYTVTAEPGPAGCEIRGADETGCVLGSTAGTSYTVTVVAHTAAGVDSFPSNPSAAVIPSEPHVTFIPPATNLKLTSDAGAANPTAGQRIVVSGSRFAAYSTVAIALYSQPQILAMVGTDGDGRFTAAVTVPTGVAAGPHTLMATGVGPTGAARAMKLAVTVAVADSATGDGGAGGGDTLAITGIPVTAMVLAGLVLILTGAALSWSGRPRRRNV